LTFIGIVSLIWSSLTLIGSVVMALVLLLVGAGSWFLSPMAGVVGTTLATLIIVWMAASSILSILLFNAGWKTLKDNPAGITLHRLWAWISLALDAIALLGSGGTAPNSWTGIVYAIAVLIITSSPEVTSYYSFDPRVKPPDAGTYPDDLI
jgi:hypothetical protein